MAKIMVAVMFGGKSPEHEVSVITGLQVLENIDREKYDAIPVYVAKDGRLFTGKKLEDILIYKNLSNIPQLATQITINVDEEQKGFLILKKGLGSFRKAKVEKADIVFQAFHGGLGENGGFAGLFEVMNLPYVGPGIEGGILGMDKIIMKQLFERENIPVSKWIWFYRKYLESNFEVALNEIEKQLKYPIFVKPANGGSSIGTVRAHSRKELVNAAEVAMQFDNKIIFEEGFENSREINISVVGNAGGELEVSACEEVFHTKDLLSYEDKYVGNAKIPKSKGMASASRQVPAKLLKEVEEKIQRLAKKVFDITDGSGVSRIDFLYNEKSKQVIVLEINTIPGSLAFYLWEKSGVSFKELLTKLIELGFERFKDRQKNCTVFPSNILQNLGKTLGSKVK
jgi:D-alanine-D-alanine ligase